MNDPRAKLKRLEHGFQVAIKGLELTPLQRFGVTAMLEMFVGLVTALIEEIDQLKKQGSSPSQQPQRETHGNSAT